MYVIVVTCCRLQTIATKHKDFVFDSLASATQLAFDLLRALGDTERVRKVLRKRI